MSKKKFILAVFEEMIHEESDISSIQRTFFPLEKKYSEKAILFFIKLFSFFLYFFCLKFFLNYISSKHKPESEQADLEIEVIEPVHDVDRERFFHKNKKLILFSTVIICIGFLFVKFYFKKTIKAKLKKKDRPIGEIGLLEPFNDESNNYKYILYTSLLIASLTVSLLTFSGVQKAIKAIETAEYLEGVGPYKKIPWPRP